MFLNILLLFLVSLLYAGVLLVNDYLSKRPDSSFLSPILMSSTVVMLVIVPINLNLSLKIHILCILIINVIGWLTYARLKTFIKS